MLYTIQLFLRILSFLICRIVEQPRTLKDNLVQPLEKVERKPNLIFQIETVFPHLIQNHPSFISKALENAEAFKNTKKFMKYAAVITLQLV